MVTVTAVRDEGTGRFVSMGPRSWGVFVVEHPCVKAAFGHKAVGTQEQYCGKLMEFREEMGVSPERFLQLDKFKARDLA